MESILFNTILVILTAYLMSYLINKVWPYLLKREGLENYQDYSGNTDEMKILVYKNAGNIASLKDAVDRLIQSSTDTQGRLSSLEKEHENLNNVLKETKATADETKANVNSAVSDYKAQGDQQADALNNLTFEEDADN
jgi:chromosome segregation ATPase